MDKICFGLGTTEEPSIDIFINGQNLIDIVKEIELVLAPHIGQPPDMAGDYTGLSPSGHFLSSGYFLGQRKNKEDKTILLRCAGCGEEYCTSLLATITVENDRVIWHNFSDRDRIWNYGEMQFVFSRSQYQEELSRFEQYLQSNYGVRVNLYNDPEYGWAIFIPLIRDNPYFDLSSTAELIVDDQRYPCELKDITREFWSSVPIRGRTEWKVRIWERTNRVIVLPRNPNLLYDWLNEYLDMELFLTIKKNSQHLNPGYNNNQAIALKGGMNAVVQILQSSLLYKIQPLRKEYESLATRYIA